MFTKKITLIASLVASALAITGCGSDSTAEAPPSQSNEPTLSEQVSSEPAVTEAGATDIDLSALADALNDEAQPVEADAPAVAASASPAAAPTAASVQPAAPVTMTFVEGTHYQVVDGELSSEPQVIEFFSFNCIHCYTFAPTFDQAKKELAGDNIAASSMHVDFLGNNGRDLTWAYAMMVIMGVEDKVKMPLFAAIHDSRARINRNSIADLFVLHGVSREQFDNYANSFAVNGLEARMRQATMQQRVRGTPTVIVNGIYEVQRGAVRTPAEIAALARFLRDRDF